jgi:hypothetical protein
LVLEYDRYLHCKRDGEGSGYESSEKGIGIQTSNSGWFLISKWCYNFLKGNTKQNDTVLNLVQSPPGPNLSKLELLNTVLPMKPQGNDWMLNYGGHRKRLTSYTVAWASCLHGPDRNESDSDYESLI